MSDFAFEFYLQLPCSSVQVFDPKLFSIEKSAIKELGLSLISHNEVSLFHFLFSSYIYDNY